jgi:hypothetical protein
VAPALSAKNVGFNRDSRRGTLNIWNVRESYPLVWDETVRCYNSLISSEGWDQQKSVLVAEVNGYASQAR